MGALQAIYRARIDGADRQIIAEKLSGISAMTVDHVHDVVIFAMDGKNIDIMDIHGKNR